MYRTIERAHELINGRVKFLLKMDVFLIQQSMF